MKPFYITRKEYEDVKAMTKEVMIEEIERRGWTRVGENEYTHPRRIPSYIPTAGWIRLRASDFPEWTPNNFSADRALSNMQIGVIMMRRMRL